MQGINIFSGESGLGSALTNPTELAFRKGMLSTGYPVVYHGMRFPDVESGYQRLKVPGDDEHNNTLLTELIAEKFNQYPALYEEVTKRGGAEWLAACSHHTGARSASAQSWEGVGLHSRFIRLLIAGYRLAGSDEFLTQGNLF